MTLLSEWLSHLVFLYLILGAPLTGLINFRKLKQYIEKDSIIRIRAYWSIILSLWLLLTAVMVILMPVSRPLERVGLRIPPLQSSGFILIIGLITVLTVILYLYMGSKRPGIKELYLRLLKPVAFLLPVTRRERRVWVILSVSAGICEEIVFRGFLFFYLQSHIPGISLLWQVVVSSLIFGFGHLYQGWKGIIGTAGLGCVFAVVFIKTGSLIPLMVIHTLVDIRVLAFTKHTD